MCRIVESKNYDLLDQFEVDKTEIERFLKRFYKLESKKLIQLDNLYSKMSISNDKFYEETAQYSIISEQIDEYKSTYIEFDVCNSESEYKVKKVSEFNSSKNLADESKTVTKEQLNISKTERFGAYSRASIKKHIKSTVISSSTRSREKQKRKIFNPFKLCQFLWH